MTEVIPNDIDQISSDIVRTDYSKDDMEPDWLLYVAIARAILAERRRCALIARQWETSSFQDEHYAANSIADKIMAGEA